MKTETDGTCRLCFKLMYNSTYEVLDGTITDMLDILLIKLNTVSAEQPLVCSDCLEKLKYAFNFKSTCIDTEDPIVPHIIPGISQKIDLKLFGINPDKIKNETGEMEVCRLCKHFAYSSSVSSLIKILEEHHMVDIFAKHLPEIALHATENPVICETCQISLQKFADFIFAISCVDTEVTKAIVHHIQGETLAERDMPSTSKIKLETEYMDTGIKDIKNEIVKDELINNEYDVLIKTEQNENERCLSSKQGKIKYVDSIDEPVYKCDKCSQEIKSFHNFQRHMLTHCKDIPDIQKYACKLCTYQANQIGKLKMHLLVHKEVPESEMLQCPSCPYKGKHKYNLRRHMRVHRRPDKIKMYKCAVCSHETKYKNNLNNHMLTHRPTEELEMFKCHICKFQTKIKNGLRKHMLSHKTPDEIEMHECQFCSYKAKRRPDLMEHMLRHRAMDEVDLFKCDKCTYITRIKSDLQKHTVYHHRNPEDLVMHKCGLCSYETKLKSNLNKHLVTHKKVEEIEMFKCNLCHYQAKAKNNLNNHMLVHKTREQVEMHKCSLCAFQTKFKGNLTKHLAKHENSELIRNLLL